MFIKMPRRFPKDKTNYSFYPFKEGTVDENGILTVWREGIRFHFHRDLSLKDDFVKSMLSPYCEKGFRVKRTIKDGRDFIVELEGVKE